MLSISNFYDKLQIYAKYILLLLFWLSINTGSKYIQIDNLLSNLSNYNINLYVQFSHMLF